MTREDERRIEADAQMVALAEWERRRAEKRLARQIARDERVWEAENTRLIGVLGIVIVLSAFTAGIVLIVGLAHAYSATGNEGYLWAIGLIGVGEIVGWALSGRKPTGRAS